MKKKIDVVGNFAMNRDEDVYKRQGYIYQREMEKYDLWE